MGQGQDCRGTRGAQRASEPRNAWGELCQRAAPRCSTPASTCGLRAAALGERDQGSSPDPTGVLPRRETSFGLVLGSSALALPSKRPSLLGLLLVVGLVFLPQRSWAFVDLGQGDWLSGQNELFVQLLATEIEELANLGSILSNMRLAVQAGNETLALARQSYRAYQAVRNYSLEDLARDAKAGLYKAFPDLGRMEQDVNLLGEQGKAIDGNHFFSYWNSYDYKMAKVVNRVLTHAYKSTIWPMVFPEAMIHRQNPSPVDIKIWGLYRKSGMEMEVAVQQTALGTLAQRVANLVEDAEESGNLELMAQASAAQSAHQSLVNSTEFLNLYKAELAAREQARDTSGRRSRALAEGMQENMSRILRPGGGMLEE